MKLEDMTREQLINEVRRCWAETADLNGRLEHAWSRFDQANEMRNSYIKEFADRALIYIPKTPKGIEE